MHAQQGLPVNQSRKSSLSSANYNPTTQHQPIKQRNTSTSSTVATGGNEQIYTRQSRSRESSVSGMPPPPPQSTFTPFNPYNPSSTIDTGYFDPNQQQQQQQPQLNIPKSQTFPTNQQANQHIKEEPSSDDVSNAVVSGKPQKQYYYDDEDDQLNTDPSSKLSNDGAKSDLKSQQNEQQNKVIY